MAFYKAFKGFSMAFEGSRLKEAEKGAWKPAVKP